MNGRAADEAFGLLGEETRMAILQALWAVEDEVVPFAELQERVGASDSGRFNYHLSQLDGHFVTSEADGWRLTQSGRAVVRAVAAGTMTERPEVPAQALSAECDECDGDLVFRYDEYATVECADCGATVMWNEFPPAALEDQDAEAAAQAFDRWTQRRFRLAMDGVCPNCAAGMATTLEESPDEADGITTGHRCPNCQYEARVPLFGHVLEHPAVVAFYHERGVDITSMPYWSLRSLARAFDERVVSRDPWRAAVVVAADGDRLRVVLDEDLAVAEVKDPES